MVDRSGTAVLIARLEGRKQSKDCLQVLRLHLRELTSRYGETRIASDILHINAPDNPLLAYIVHPCERSNLVGTDMSPARFRLRYRRTMNAKAFRDLTLRQAGLLPSPTEARANGLG